MWIKVKEFLIMSPWLILFGVAFIFILGFNFLTHIYHKLNPPKE